MTSITEAKQQFDIVEVARRLGLHPEYKHRKDWVAYCPFHDDQHPSLVLNTHGKHAGRYKCWACGNDPRAAGDSIDLVRFVMNFDSPMDAVRWLTGEDRREPIARPKDVITLEAPVINEDLTAFAHQAYVERSDAVLEYLRKRRLLKIVDRFRLGSTDSPSFPRDLLPLYWDSESGKTMPHKNFLNRLIIPYLQPDGVVRHVNARALGDKKPKYLKKQQPHRKAENPPYLLEYALDVGGEDIWITEGELDALSVYVAQPHFAVAGIPGVACLEPRYLPEFEGRRVWIMLDNDAAGLAARKAYEEMLRPYADVHQVHLPEAFNDVNQALVEQGAEWLRGYTDAAVKKALRKTVRRTF